MAPYLIGSYFMIIASQSCLIFPRPLSIILDDDEGDHVSLIHVLEMINGVIAEQA